MPNANTLSHSTIQVDKKINKRGNLTVPITMLRAVGLDRGSQIWIEVVDETTLAISRQRPTTSRPHYPAEVSHNCSVYLCTDLRAQVKFTPDGMVKLRFFGPTIPAHLIS